MKPIVQVSRTLSRSDNVRYIVVDDTTGQVLLNCNGIGYASVQAAVSAWRRKCEGTSRHRRPHKQVMTQETQWNDIAAYLRKHPSLRRSLSDLYHFTQRQHYSLSIQDIREVMAQNFIDTLPFPIEDLQRYILNQPNVRCH